MRLLRFAGLAEVEEEAEVDEAAAAEEAAAACFVAINHHLFTLVLKEKQRTFFSFLNLEQKKYYIFVSLIIKRLGVRFVCQALDMYSNFYLI